MAHLGNTVVNGALRVLGQANTDALRTSGPLIVEADNAAGSYDEGIRINRGKSGYATLHIGGTDSSTTGTGAGQWWIGCNPAGTARRLWVAQNGSTGSSTYFGSDADGTVSPYLNLGTSGTIESGNTRAVTGGTVYTFVTGGSARDNTKIPTSEKGKTVMEVGKESSRSTSTQGTWTAMCNSSQTGSPTLPTTGQWWNVINLNNWSNSSTNWVSQLAITTQNDSNGGVWWRTNNSGGTDISSSTWHHLIDDTQLYISGDEGKITLRTSGSNRAHFYTGNVYYGPHDCNSIVENGHYYYTSNGPSTTLGAQSTDGALYSQAYNATWVGQIAQDYRNGNLFVRGRNNGTWQQWLPIPSGMIFGTGLINTHYSRDCDAYTGVGQPSIWGYYVNSGPTVAEGNTAPDRSGSFTSYSYADNGWVNQTAQNFYEHGRLFTRSREGSSFTGWFKCLDTSDIQGADYNYGVTARGNGVLMIHIRPGAWMLSFKVTIYSGYLTQVYQVCGYDYGSNHWYGASVIPLAQCGNDYANHTQAHNLNNHIFGYRNSDNYLVVRFATIGNYDGCLISDVCNGYTRITNYNNLFSVTYSASGPASGYTWQTNFNINTLGMGSFKFFESDNYSMYRTPSTAGSINFIVCGAVKMLTVWGTTWAAVSGGAVLTMYVGTTSTHTRPRHHIEFSGHDDNGQLVFGYINTDGHLYLANRSAVPVYFQVIYL